MTITRNLWPRLLLLIALPFFSTQVLANCADVCEQKRSNCIKNTSEQNARCDEQNNICKLTCNREQTLSCVYLGFKNHEGVADRENELKELTGGFARVSDEDKPHFAGLCSSHGMKCQYVLNWDKTMYSCGGEQREPTRVACCF